ncbi:hypothetical protein AC1031_001009 [Aphanomyces cochlioides]|nr:hypothetical protein AC1031_001009 [Aphanomyces cochlioides]
MEVQTATYGSFHDGLEGTSRLKTKRVQWQVRYLLAAVLFGALLLPLALILIPNETTQSRTPQDANAEFLESIEMALSSLLARVHSGKALTTTSKLSVEESAALLRQSGMVDVVVTSQEHVILTTESNTLSFEDEDGQVLFAFAPLPSLLERCSRNLDLNAKVIPFDQLSSIKHEEEHIALIPIRTTFENCRAIEASSLHGISMVLFYSDASFDDQSIVCPFYEVDLDLTPGYNPSKGWPRLSLSAAEERQGLSLPVARIPAVDALRMLDLMSASNTTKLNVARICSHKLQTERLVQATTQGSVDPDNFVVLDVQREAHGKVDSFSYVASALSTLLQDGWKPYRSIKIISRDSLSHHDDMEESHITWRVNYRAALPVRSSPELPLHSAITDEVKSRLIHASTALRQITDDLKTQTTLVHGVPTTDILANNDSLQSAKFLVLLCVQAASHPTYAAEATLLRVLDIAKIQATVKPCPFQLLAFQNALEALSGPTTPLTLVEAVRWNAELIKVDTALAQLNKECS